VTQSQRGRSSAIAKLEEQVMPKNANWLLDLFALNLCRAGDCYHAATFAYASAIVAVAFFATGEIAFALWALAFAVAFASAVVRAVSEAWIETKREIRKAIDVPATSVRRNNSGSRSSVCIPRKHSKVKKPKNL